MTDPELPEWNKILDEDLSREEFLSPGLAELREMHCDIASRLGLSPEIPDIVYGIGLQGSTSAYFSLTKVLRAMLDRIEKLEHSRPPEER